MKDHGTSSDKDRKIVVTEDGPYHVSGSVPLSKDIKYSDSEGTPVRWEQASQYPLEKEYDLCRCGHSGQKPFCDGSHVMEGFDGTETATHQPREAQAETFTGPGLVLSDNPGLCSAARFCHRAGDAWTLTEASQDPAAKKMAIEEACDCPSGRLVARDPVTGTPIEPAFTPSIGVGEDPYRKISGPLCVRGGIPLQGADGAAYEVRNRMTLCRCGKSKNKPFCDGTHLAVKFNDGDTSVK